MPNKADKAVVVDDLTQKFRDSQGVLITEYRGLNVAEVSRLRGQLRPANVRYQVVKNTLARRAMAEAGIEPIDKALTGPTALAFCMSDVVAGAKALNDYARTSRILTITGGVLGGKLISPAEVTELATLPSREVLIAWALGGVQSPLVGLVSVLSGTIRGLQNVLQARIQQLEQGVT